MILDLGAGQNPDPRCTHTVDLHADADINCDLREDWPLDDDTITGIVASHVIEHLDAEHVFDEASRVLHDDGWLEVRVPLGENAWTDPAHEHAWTYSTPLIFDREYSREHGREWDPSPPFTLTDRELSVGLGGPLKSLSGVFQRVGERWPEWAAQRCMRGELTARYRRRSRC